MSIAASASLHRVIDSFKQIGIVQKLRARSCFAVAVTVETGPNVNFQEACHWALPSEDGPDRNLQGRVKPRLLFPEAPHCLWEFEIDDDAILFMARFGGVAYRDLDVDQWRSRMLADMQSHR